jgi:catechol 2,3-dioxygenase-like lactoylglutathione lyase family enzyme
VDRKGKAADRLNGGVSSALVQTHWITGGVMKMNRLIPMLPVKSMPASVEFYAKLGFAVESRNDDWGWAMVRFDECRLMLDQSINQHPAGSREAVVYLYPDDIVEYHAQARRNGLKIPDLDETFYGMREFRLDDPDGNRLWIGQSKSG